MWYKQDKIFIKIGYPVTVYTVFEKIGVGYVDVFVKIVIWIFLGYVRLDGLNQLANIYHTCSWSTSE